MNESQKPNFDTANKWNVLAADFHSVDSVLNKGTMSSLEEKRSTVCLVNPRGLFVKQTALRPQLNKVQVLFYISRQYLKGFEINT